jgi:hypothetical protein
MSKFNKTLSIPNTLGIMLFDVPLPGKYINKLMTMTDSKNPASSLVKWQTQGIHERVGLKKDGINIVYSSCIVLHSAEQQYELFLYKIPESYRTDFLISELQMPVAVKGVIVIVEASPSFVKESGRSWIEILKRYRDDLDLSPIAWVRWNNLPFIVVLIKEADDVPMISVDDLVEIYDLDSNTPIIDCPAGLNKEKVEEILQTTVNYIKP